MKRFSLLLGVALVLASFPQVVTAQGTPKVGSVCPKLNQRVSLSGYLYICIKSKQKLAWSRKVTAMPTPTPIVISKPQASEAPSPSPSPTATAVPSPTPSAKPTPNPSPTPTKYLAPIPIQLPVPKGAITFDNILQNMSSVAEAAYNSVQAVYAANSAPVGITSTVWVGPNTPVLGASSPEQLFAKPMRLWAGFNQPKMIGSFFFDTQDEPAAEIAIAKWAADNNINYPQGPDYVRGECPPTGSAGSPLGQCQNANASLIDSLGNAVGIFGIPDLNDPQHRTAAYWAGHLQTHEFTHMVQGAQFFGGGYTGPQGNYQTVTPCWMSEGPANFASMGMNSTFQEYLKMRRGEALYRKAGNGLETPRDLATISSYISLQGLPDCESTYSWGYGTGMLIIEALSAIGGAQSTMALYTEEAHGHTFTEAFELVYGVTWDYAQPILARVIANDYLLPSMNE